MGRFFIGLIGLLYVQGRFYHFATYNGARIPWETLYRGFYPRIHDQGIPPEVWLKDYIRTYIERDVRTLINIGDLTTFANDCGIALDTGLAESGPDMKST